MLLGLVINYGILAPRLIDDKVIEHPAPTIRAAAAPQLPLAIKAGQTFAVKLEKAAKQPELPTAEELKAHPELASTVSTRLLRYTWTRPTVYDNLADVKRDLNAKTLQNGSPNPLYGLSASSVRGQFESLVHRMTTVFYSLHGLIAPSVFSPEAGRVERLVLDAGRHPLGSQPPLADGPARRSGEEYGLHARRRVADDDRRLPQHQRLVALAGGHRVGGRRAAGAGLPMADPGADLRQHLHQLRQPNAMPTRARWITSKFP